MSELPPSDEQFCSRIEQGLANYPNLGGRLPEGYPRAGKSRVVKECALEFEKRRTKRFRHNFNLPLALYFIGYEKSPPGVSEFARQMLKDIDIFVSEFKDTPGVDQVLQPLWKAPWDKNDPTMWSVIAHANLGSLLRGLGACVLRFEAPIGTGTTTADIEFRLAGQDYLLDLEVWNAATGSTAEEIRRKGVQRAERKAAQKFANLPPKTLGIVVEFCFSSGGNFEQIANNQHILSDLSISETAGCKGYLCLICAIGDANGQNSGYQFVTSSSPPLHIRPRTTR